MAIREHADLLQEIPFDGWLVVEGVILDSTPASEIKGKNHGISED